MFSKFNSETVSWKSDSVIRDEHAEMKALCKRIIFEKDPRIFDELARRLDDLLAERRRRINSATQKGSWQRGLFRTMPSSKSKTTATEDASKMSQLKRRFLLLLSR